MRRHALVLVALFLAAAVAPLSVQARSLVIERFDATIAVKTDGTMDVTETIQPHFTGAWNGIFRTIPVEYRTPQGMNYTLFLDLLGITDGAGTPLKIERSRDRHYLKIKIWVPGAADTTRTIILRYRVQNGLKFFDEHDELYWNVTGDEWQAPIRAASARIQLPSGITGLRAVAFTGVYGSREQAASMEIDQDGVSIRALRPLNFREGLTVAVGWDPGLIPRPGWLAQAILFLRSNWMLGIPLVIFGIMFSLWFARGRDPRRRPIAPQYNPPEELTPAEAGTLVDNSADIRDITATLVDLAVRGYVQIEEKEERKLLGLIPGREYTFDLRKPSAEWHTLRPHEQALLEAMFSGGVQKSVKSSDLEHRFYRHLPRIRDRIFDGLLERRYYARRPDRIRVASVVIGIAVGIALAIGGSLLSGAWGLSPLPAILGAFLSAAIVIGFGWIMPARTVRGARALEGVLGFEEFLARVEGDQFRRLDKSPELFEKYLPYAMALGVEKHWARAFEGIYRQPPEWYRGHHYDTFHSGSFVSNLSHMSAQTATAMASSPRSSGGSGFGGGSSGGSSGGGMGGGGGGGF